MEDSILEEQKPEAQKHSLENTDVKCPNLDMAQLLSKRQIKKLAKKEKWLLQKPLRRAREKEKKREKLQRARENGSHLGPSRKQLKLAKMVESSCKLKVAVDMSLDYLMTESELSKTLKQLHRCYSLNRRAKAPLQFYITSFTNGIQAKMSSTSGCLNWDIHFREQLYTEVFGKGNIVYLTSESSTVLENIDHDKAYVIGGLVDHNRYKGLCHKLAIEKEVNHARLPIDEFLVMKTRKVLTIDQVFLILLRVSEGKSWKEAFLSVLPKRKGAEEKNFSSNSCSSEETKHSDRSRKSLKQTDKVQ